ncbi:YlbD family protein [Bacillus sp. FSL K6-3431]|uniref:YlbD family protein n=1 Tax=Bacillus sp. FSL K6-3431 TaxID=2921500 RepID=UPI0030FB10DE
MVNKLHPSVEQFKQFVKQHPKITQIVKNKENTWQELYEDWYLLGAEDPKWDDYRENNIGKKESVTGKEEKGWINQFTGLLKNMDANQVQNQVNNLSQAIGAIQGVLSQFQGQNGQTTEQEPSAKQHPFAFRKD